MTNNIKTIKDKNIKHDLTLYSDGMKVYVVNKNKIFQIKLNK
jgi:hypothetical protein